MYPLRLLSFLVGPILVTYLSVALAQSVVVDVNHLRNHTWGTSGTATLIALQNYSAGPAGGGGLLTNNGATSTCDILGVPGSTSSGSKQITGISPFPSGVFLGMKIGTNSLNIPTGDSITAFSVLAQTITLQTAVGTGVSGGTFAIDGDNGGTTFKDNSGFCFTRVNSTFGPREWGAKGTGSSDDTIALQNWLYSIQPHLGDAGFYNATSPLICPANTTIQGPANLDGYGNTPVFGILAKSGGSGFPSGQGVIQAYDYCRISGVGLDANDMAIAVNILGENVVIDGFSSLRRGSPNNLYCGSAPVSGLQVEDSSLGNAAGDGTSILGNCSDVQLIGDIFAQSAGRGVVFAGDGLSIADGVIEESNGVGLDLSGARNISVTAMHLQGNGQGPTGGAAIVLDGSKTISIVGNHIEGNGGNVTPSAQIYFGNLIGPSDNVIFSANVYQTQSLSDVALRPLYVYDADSGAVLTNAHFFDGPEPQASGSIYSSNAAAILPQLQSPHAPLGQINGLILRNDSTATKVDALAGEAADSTGSVIMQLPSGCSVDLANQGAAGLDVTPRAATTTYFYFAISSASGANANCIASTSLAPSFVNAGASYALATTGSTLNGNTLVYNLASVAGIAPGQLVQGSYILSGTTVSAVGTYTFAQTGDFGTSTTTITFSVGISLTNIGKQMAISDVASIPGSSCTPASAIPSNDWVDSVDTSMNTVTLHTAITSSPPSNDCITISGGNTVTLSAGATNDRLNTAITFYTGLYRLIGALYTDGSQNVVHFTQDGDRFYLANSVNDISATGIGVVPQTFALSVPCGRSAPTCLTPGPGLRVEAFGRMVGGPGDVLLSSLDQGPQVPNAFPGPPGYSTNSLFGAIKTGFPFRLYTNGNGQIRLQASSPGNTAYEVTDGWILHR